MIDGNVEQAVADYAKLAGEDREIAAEILRDAFAVLSAYGHLEAAAAVGRLRLAKTPMMIPCSAIC